ncbi:MULTISPECIES: CopG family ribbon-helix-helix protein [Sphingomonas]|uniref:CopG family ribbon-helix-helix protein n=1 Tax=Sphingomonas TaxID=13687 RepID=UPI00082B6E3C|nr:ribbon-helix-helix protein, CopG family [Sphingomonas sp. CCH10-B3]
MSNSIVVTTRLDSETIDLVDRVASAGGHSRSKFVARAVAEAVRREAAFLDFVQEGLDDLDAGRTVSHEVVMAELDAMIAKHEARCRD